MPDGWWYDGGGIYRSIHLHATQPVHVVPWGVYLPSSVKEGSIRAAFDEDDAAEAGARRQHDLVGDAVLNAQVTVVNDGPAPATFAVHVMVAGPGLGFGPEAVARSPAPFTLAPGATGTFTVPVELPGVSLWSVQYPHLLQVTVQLWDETPGAPPALLDQVAETTGVRTLRFDPQQGFFLNGVPTKIQGMCNHQVREYGREPRRWELLQPVAHLSVPSFPPSLQDFAGVGVAVPPSLQAYRVWRMKDMGANAWRTAHNPPTPELLDETDRQGLMVWVSR